MAAPSTFRGSTGLSAFRWLRPFLHDLPAEMNLEYWLDRIDVLLFGRAARWTDRLPDTKSRTEEKHSADDTSPATDPPDEIAQADRLQNLECKAGNTHSLEDKTPDTNPPEDLVQADQLPDLHRKAVDTHSPEDRAPDTDPPDDHVEAEKPSTLDSVSMDDVDLHLLLHHQEADESLSSYYLRTETLLAALLHASGVLNSINPSSEAIQQLEQSCLKRVISHFIHGLNSHPMKNAVTSYLIQRIINEEEYSLQIIYCYAETQSQPLQIPQNLSFAATSGNYQNTSQATGGSDVRYRNTTTDRTSPGPTTPPNPFAHLQPTTLTSNPTPSPVSTTNTLPAPSKSHEPSLATNPAATTPPNPFAHLLPSAPASVHHPLSTLSTATVAPDIFNLWVSSHASEKSTDLEYRLGGPIPAEKGTKRETSDEAELSLPS